MWDLATLQPVRTLTGVPGFVQGVAFSADGKLLAATSNEIIKVWNLDDGKVVQTFKGPKDKVESAAWPSAATARFSSRSVPTTRSRIAGPGFGQSTGRDQFGEEPSACPSNHGKMLAVTMDGEQTAGYNLSAIVGK